MLVLIPCLPIPVLYAPHSDDTFKAKPDKLPVAVLFIYNTMNLNYQDEASQVPITAISGQLGIC